MSVFYSPGYTPEWRYQRWDATTTLAFWTPRTGNSVVLTGLNISNNAAAGTFAIFYGTTNSGPQIVAQFTIGASATVFPAFSPIEGTIKGGVFYGRPSSSPSDGFTLTALGFEVE